MMDGFDGRTQRSFLAALMCFLLIGCGGTYDSYVTGAITLDGEPLPRGTIAFNPNVPGAPSYGRVDGDGTYTIQTGRNEGLRSGQYVVTVVANEAPTEVGADGGPPPAGKPITPRWYRSIKSSGLSCTVEAGSNEINFDLTTEPPSDWEP